MSPLLLRSFTATSCVGTGNAASLATLAACRGGLKPCDFETVRIDTHIGEVSGVDAQTLPAGLKRFDCRNNRLAELALRQDDFSQAVAAAVAQYGRPPIGLFIGTSTAAILQTELAYREPDSIGGALPACC